MRTAASRDRPRRRGDVVLVAVAAAAGAGTTRPRRDLLREGLPPTLRVSAGVARRCREAVAVGEAAERVARARKSSTSSSRRMCVGPRLLLGCPRPRVKRAVGMPSVASRPVRTHPRGGGKSWPALWSAASRVTTSASPLDDGIPLARVHKAEPPTPLLERRWRPSSCHPKPTLELVAKSLRRWKISSIPSTSSR